MKNEIIGGAIGTGISAIGAGLNVNDVLETISICTTIIGGLITFIIIPLITWYKQSKKDGKIDKEELNELHTIISDGSEKIKNEIENKEEK